MGKLLFNVFHPDSLIWDIGSSKVGSTFVARFASLSEGIELFE